MNYINILFIIIFLLLLYFLYSNIYEYNNTEEPGLKQSKNKKILIVTNKYNNNTLDLSKYASAKQINLNNKNKIKFINTDNIKTIYVGIEFTNSDNTLDLGEFKNVITLFLYNKNSINFINTDKIVNITLINEFYANEIKKSNKNIDVNLTIFSNLNTLNIKSNETKLNILVSNNVKYIYYILIKNKNLREAYKTTDVFIINNTLKIEIKNNTSTSISNSIKNLQV